MKANLKLDKEKFRREVLKRIDQFDQQFDQVVLTRLVRIGEQFVTEARTGGAYRDHTGNLRSSIGYLVMKSGKVIAQSNFDPSGSGSDKTTGSKKGKAFVSKLAEEHGRGYVLICVAGMDYAAAVESGGIDVITGSAQKVEDEVKQLVAKVLAKLKKK